MDIASAAANLRIDNSPEAWRAAQELFASPDVGVIEHTVKVDRKQVKLSVYARSLCISDSARDAQLDALIARLQRPVSLIAQIKQDMFGYHGVDEELHKLWYRTLQGELILPKTLKTAREKLLAKALLAKAIIESQQVTT